MPAWKRLADLFIGINLEDLAIYFVVVPAIALAAYTLSRGWRGSRRVRNARPQGHLLRELGNSVRTVLIFASTTTVVVALLYSAFPSVYAWQDTLGMMRKPSVAITLVSLPIMLFIQDAYFYWTHRLLHLRPFQWIHREHHRSAQPAAWTAYSFSPLEAAVHGAFIALYTFIVPTRLETAVAFAACALAFNASAHSGYEFWPRWLVVSGGVTGSTYHDIHHAAPRHNFGLYLRLWDRLMGTEQPRFDAIYDFVLSKENDGRAYARFMGQPDRTIAPRATEHPYP